MNSYQAATPRARVFISLAAAAMTALTLGLTVLPATLHSDGNVGLVANASRAAGTVASTVPGDGMPIAFADRARALIPVTIATVRVEERKPTRSPWVCSPGRDQSFALK